MTWRDELRPASWRGLACHVEAAEAQGGRRLALHEFPLRDDPYPEDLGRKARAWSVTAFLLGAEVLSAARAFAAALEEAGSGTWVDPWRGDVAAVVESYSWRQSSREGGIARFEIQFREAGQAAYPALAPDHSAAVEAAAETAAVGWKEKFGEGFSVSGLAEALKADIGDLIGTTVTDLSALTSDAVATIDQAAAWARAGLQLAADARTLIETPSLLADRAMALMGADRLGGLGWRSWLNIATWAPILGGLEGAGPAATQARANRSRWVGLINQAGVIGAAKAAAAADFATRDEAIEARTAIVAAMDAVEGGTSAAEYQVLAALRTALVRAVSAAAPRLPRLMRLDRPQPLPALALAWELYGDAPASVPDRADEIVARNRTRHPLFVVPPVQVLSYG